MFTSDLEESAREKKHLTASQAAKIARDGGVEKLGLIHYSPRYTKWDLKQLLEEAKGIHENCFLTQDGQSLEISNKDE